MRERFFDLNDVGKKNKLHSVMGEILEDYIVITNDNYTVEMGKQLIGMDNEK